MDRSSGIAQVWFTPTVPHCSLSTVIGLAIRTKIVEEFIVDPGLKLFVFVSAGAHDSEVDINRQINDKERVCAALENPNLLRIIRRTTH